MDRKVDLTLRRDFKNNSSKNSSVDNIRQQILLFLNVNNRLPWRSNTLEEVHTDSELKNNNYINYNTIIIGNKEERDQYKRYREYTERVCDRCGADLTKIPWKNLVFSICNNCEKEMYSKRICWKDN